VDIENTHEELAQIQDDDSRPLVHNLKKEPSRGTTRLLVVLEFGCDLWRKHADREPAHREIPDHEARTSRSRSFSRARESAGPMEFSEMFKLLLISRYDRPSI